MAKQKQSKLTKRKAAVVHKELGKLDIRINEFGKIIGQTPVEEINNFLNRHVQDWKLEEKEEKEKSKKQPAAKNTKPKPKK